MSFGLFGLLRSYKQEKEEDPEEKHGPPRVYRRSLCRIDEAALRRLIELENTVQLHARENRWPVDWAAHEQQLRQAGDFFREGRILEAYREHLRGLALLTQASRLHRNKGETFKPLW
jgi:hypothetical protein